MLGALIKAGTAPDTIACETCITYHSARCRDVLMHTLVPAMSERRVVRGKAHEDGDIDNVPSDGRPLRKNSTSLVGDPVLPP